jgi:trk system potassium uptake protein TrkH
MTRVETGVNAEGIVMLGGMIGSGLLLLDVVWAAGWSGVLALAGMLSWLVVLAHRRLTDARDLERPRSGAVLAVEVVVGIALVSMVIARGYVLTLQFGAESSGELGAVARLYTIVFVVVASLSVLSTAMPERLARLLLRTVQRPALLLVGSFAVLIVVMTFVLMLPISVEEVADVSFVDALFTVTSAVCVTGLVVNDPGSTYTFFGEAVVLLSIQLGGIGIMTIAALSLMFARDTALATQLRYAKILDVRTLADLRTTVASIVIGTLVLEAIGAVALWFMLEGDPRIGDASPAWIGLFHSVSAFCNAGFSILDGGLAALQTDVPVQCVVLALVVTGGLGFPVLRELALRAVDWVVHVLDRSSPRPPRLGLTSRVVVVTSGALILGGALVIGVLEWRGQLHGLSGGHGVLAALFMSVNTRTAGFNTVDVGAFGATSLLVMCVLMFIGGSPGSTAGGIKTTTFATILATLRAELRGGETRLWRRAIATEVVRRAVAVATLSTAICVLALMALTLTETHDFLQLLFETVSAFATVGLSTGITPDLSVPGKIIVSLTMFVGRVGPLTIALGVARRVGVLRYRLARESLPIG